MACCHLLNVAGSFWLNFGKATLLILFNNLKIDFFIDLKFLFNVLIYSTGLDMCVLNLQNV